MFMVLVIIHELGHFIAAKKSGVQVKEFWLGIPPRLFTFWTDKSGTKYSINAIPLGGFVALGGEDPTDEKEALAPGSFMLAAWRKKLIITAAGVAVNLLFAWMLLVVVFSLGIKPISIVPSEAFPQGSQSYLMPSIDFLQEKGFLSGDIGQKQVILSQDPLAGSLAESLELQAGDVLTAINGEALDTENLATILSSLALDTEHSIQIHQWDTEREVFFQCGKDCSLGIVYDRYPGVDVLPIKMPFVQALGAGLEEIKGEWKLTMTALGNLGPKLFSFKSKETKEAISQLSGPVAIIKLGEFLFFQEWLLAFLGFMAIISLALAFFNILPIPALDGGRFIGILIQKIFRIKPTKYAIAEGWINTIFFRLLMGLGIVIIFKDLIMFWGLKLPFF